MGLHKHLEVVYVSVFYVFMLFYFDSSQDVRYWWHLDRKGLLPLLVQLFAALVEVRTNSKQNEILSMRAQRCHAPG